MAQKKKIGIGGALLGGAVIGDALGKKIAKSIKRMSSVKITTTGEIKTKGRKKKGIFG